MGPRAWALILALAGCAWHGRGLVEPGASGAHLTDIHGRRVLLVTDEASRPLQRLDGHLTEVWGRRFIGPVQVRDWRVLEGVHGLAVWVGPVVLQGVQVGLQDHNSGSFYFVDREAARVLGARPGETVLVEGHVDGPNRVKVLYYRWLEGTAGAEAQR
jgi:hypothetical protein